ncbi:MAG: four helix bundle protein [Ignavibacteria bacterium]|nr:four helix bundle protein [Ignavibacteria bacterium]
MAVSSVIKDKSLRFAFRIVKLYKYLTEKKKEYVLSKQVLKCGTSIGANVEEAHGAISKKDFSNKISIAYKEARETLYWLKLLQKGEFINQKQCDSLSKDCEELNKILFSILKTMRIEK